MYKGIFDLLQFVGIGGLISAVGGALGKLVGDAIASPCRRICQVQLGTVTWDNCLSACPDAWQYAVIGAIPGILIGVIWYIKEKKENAERLR